MGCRAVSINWVGRLRVAHFNKGRADRNSLLAVEEDLSSFSLGGGSNDGTDGLTFGEDRFVHPKARSCATGHYNEKASSDGEGGR